MSIILLEEIVTSSAHFCVTNFSFFLGLFPRQIYATFIATLSDLSRPRFALNFTFALDIMTNHLYCKTVFVHLWQMQDRVKIDQNLKHLECQIAHVNVPSFSQNRGSFGRLFLSLVRELDEEVEKYKNA